jgi:protein TonB
VAKALKVAGGAYPAAARRAHREGVVIVRAEVLETGNVGGAEVRESSGCADLDEAALKAAKEWTFEPALVNGRRVKSWATVRCRYELK